MKDESSGGYWKRIKQTHDVSPLVLAVVVVAALCVALSLRLLRSSKGTAPQELLADFPEAIYGFCTTPSCQQAVDDMKAALNSSVVPCQDMYGFACGNWERIANTTEISGARVRLSYMQGLEENLLRFLETQLLTSTQDSDARKIGIAYKSCVTFYTNQSADLTRMWPAAMIEPEAWLTARDHVHLIEMVVDSILVNHLPSIFALVYHANGTVDIKIGTGIRDKSLFTLGQYMMTAKNFPGNDWYRARQAEIKAFNDAVNDICKQYQGIQNPFVSVSARYFKRDPVAALFSGAIMKHLKTASKPAAKLIRYPDDPSVLHMADTFGKFDVKLAAVYLLHVPFAELVNFEKESSVLRGNYGHSKTRSVCADYIHGLFKNAFHSMVSTPRTSSDFLTYVNGIWKRIQEAAAGRPFAGGVRLREDPVPPNATITLHGTVGNIDNVAEGALKANYGKDFIINLILYTRYTGVQVDIDMEDTWNVDAVDPKLLQAPFYYKEATEPYVNYATVGVSIAQTLFKESVPQEALNSPYFAACFSTYGLSHMRVVFDGRNWPQYAGLAWSLETAIDAALGVGRRSVELERFMIVRYAHTYCGEETAARQPLTYVVKSSKTFARAFGCAVPPYPYC